jgi:hypothetical protein
MAFVDKGEHFHLYLETDEAVAAAEALKEEWSPPGEDINETAWGTKNSSSKMIRATLCIFARADKFSYSAENAAIWTVRQRRDS